MSPFNIEIELRIYQNDGIQVFEARPEDIINIMDTIIEFDRHVENLKETDFDYR